jgi:hypothetical protein
MKRCSEQLVLNKLNAENSEMAAAAAAAAAAAGAAAAAHGEAGARAKTSARLLFGVETLLHFGCFLNRVLGSWTC